MWTEEMRAKALRTRMARKQERIARGKAKQDATPEQVPEFPSLQPKTHSPENRQKHGANGTSQPVDFETAPLGEAIAALSELKKTYDRAAETVLRRQTVAPKVWTCFTEKHKHEAPRSIVLQCARKILDGKWVFRDDGCFRVEDGVKIPDPAVCCSQLCFRFYQEKKTMVALSRH